MAEIPYIFNQLHQAISLPKGDMVYEDHHVIRIDNFQCQDQKPFDLLINFTKLIKIENIGNCVLSGEIWRDFDLDHPIFENIKDDTLSLVVNKSGDNGFYYFFTLKGFANALDNDEFSLTAKNVWVDDIFSNFFSLTCSFSQWDSTIHAQPIPWQGLSDTRKLVRNLSLVPNYSPPYNICPWLLAPNQELADSPVLETWKIASAKHTAKALSSEIRSSNGDFFVVFKGEKLREVRVATLTDATWVDIFQILHDCTEWIYINRQDSEIKHSLLNYQLAFEWFGDVEWPNKLFIERALISARESYKLHLQETSQELLKAYGEIKKSLHDEVNQVSENTRELVKNFWRDFAIAAGVLVIKYLTTSNLSATGTKILFISTAAFLILSLGITIITNFRFNRIVQENRIKWHERLYPFIDNISLKELVTDPISKGLVTYRNVVIITVLIYLTMSLYLLYLSICTI